MNKFSLNRRTWTLFFIIFIFILLLTVTLTGILMNPYAYSPNYEFKNLPPSFSHPFGTDFLGRDMFMRTVKGLSNSILIGLIAAIASSVIALLFGIIASVFGRKVDILFNWAADLFSSIPHIVLLMLISFMLGKGTKGIMIGIAVTHWPNLARIIRAEVKQVRSMQYIKVAEKFGLSRLQIAKKHILLHILPQFITGLILLFPHAILHEASITFLGFGLPIDMPAIGIILSEAMKHISTGMWWLVAFPGASLLLVVMTFYSLGDNLKMLLDPVSTHE